MTNLNQLIEQRQGETLPELKKNYLLSIEAGDSIGDTWNEVLLPLLKKDTTQTATLAYRQALEDVLAGLPGEQEDVSATDGLSESMDAWVGGQIQGHNTALQTVQAQIEGLLSKIE